RSRVLIFALLLASLGVGLLALTPGATSSREQAWMLPFLALMIAFGLAEAAALHVEIRKESHSLSLSGIPLMFALLYTSPALAAAAYVLGSVPTMLLVRRSNWLKTIWNASLFLAEAAAAGLIVRTLLGDAQPRTATEWLIPLGAVLVAELMSLLAVPLVIMAVDAKFRWHLFADVGHSQILAALAGTFTVTAAAASIGSPYMVLYAAIPLIGVSVLLRSSGHLTQRFHDLQQLHTFTRALSNQLGPRTLDIGLIELVQIMRSKSAGLVIIDPDREDPPTIRVLIDDKFEELDVRPIARRFLEILVDSSVTQLTTSDPRTSVGELLELLQANKILAVRVLGELNRVGVLFVTDRLGMRSDFTEDELRLFGSLANTLSARLSNDHLVERLEVQARSDALTGLPNRLSFEVAVTTGLAKPAQSGVIVMVDLDRFKEINDSLGHETGDRLLIEMARRLRTSTRANDMVARFGGDEFAMLLTSVESDGPGDFTRRIADIQSLLSSKVDLEGIRFEVGASLGVVQWPTQGRDTATLLHRADTAMYEAKRNRLGTVWYTPELDADAPRRLDLYMSASPAMENEDFYVHFQPKVSVADGSITGAEALVRWHHPAHGQIAPIEFLPLLVQAGLSTKLTRFVIRRAAATVAMFRDVGLDIPIAVNLTPRDLLDPALPDDVERIFSEASVALTSLHLEITEDSMVVDVDTSVAVLNQLRALGVLIAIDDFGTGYSSLQQLHRLPVDQLKIDRSFISRLAFDDSAAAIVRASINLANELGLTTIAEGIEDECALRIVSNLGCREIQGYLVSRPLPAYDLVRWAHGWDPQAFCGCLIEPAVRVEDVLMRDPIETVRRN
ncbi:MAG: EAL domain-containing protein, partial [Actinobacteria bacterium]|nr:EAL domain-containing protein [Actinomycetota bacterium]